MWEEEDFIQHSATVGKQGATLDAVKTAGDLEPTGTGEQIITGVSRVGDS